MFFCSLLQCLQVQTKELEGGHKLTFMKFTFQSPALEIKAPVLNDKTVGYQVIIHRIQQVEPSHHSFRLAGAPTERCLCVPQSNLQYSSRWTWRARGASGKYQRNPHTSKPEHFYSRPLATPVTLSRRYGSQRHGLEDMWLPTQEDLLAGCLDLPSILPPRP